MNDRRFQGAVERLRSPDRVARMEVARVVDLSLGRLNVSTLLDVGTGSGLFAEAFSNKGLQVTGIDVSEEMLAAARSFVPKAKFHQSPMERLPFPLASFDLVFFGLVLHEADDLTQALREAHRTVLHRVAVLEWPYEAGEFGPPLGHRLTPLQVEKTALEVGFRTFDVIPLEHLHLYLLNR